MNSRAGIITLFAVLSVPGVATQAAAQAQAPPVAAKASRSDQAKPWKPEDIVFTETAGSFRISPDGKWAVWMKSTADKEKDSRVSNLFLSSLVENKEIQLTRGTDANSQPRWSPAGELIAFLSTRSLPQAKPDAARMQLWLINPFGGEPWPLTESERGLQRFEWLDRDTLVFSAEEDPTLYERETKRKKDDSRVVDDAAHTPPVRLFKISVADKKVTRLTQNDDWIGPWAVSPDATSAVTVHQRSLSYQWDQKTPPAVFLYDLATGQRKQLFADGKIRPGFVRWARDNSGFFAATPYSTDPRFLQATIELLYFYEVATDKVTQVNLEWENGLASGIDMTRDGFLTLLAAGARFQPARYTRGAGPKWAQTLLEGEHANNLSEFVLGEDGQTIVYEYSTASLPRQWYRAQLDGARLIGPVAITHLNPQFKNKAFAKSEIIRWKGALDEEVEGVLYYPHNYEPGKRYPLVLSIHGGPTGVDLDAWSQNWGNPVNLLTQRGAFVLKPNYHGSGNYGLKWAESICCGKYYELETPDIEKGVDFLIAQGKLDPERIGTMGWSNGSILSISLLISNPTRYKAAAVGAGDVEWISDWANVDFGHAFDTYYFGKSPLEDPELYIRKSPIFKMDRVRAPTLIFFGTEDRNVPTSQGWTHYRALYHLGQVPVRFVLFPGEPHGPRKLTHQLRKVEEEMAWFDRYLFRGEKAANEAFREDSPLGQAMRRRSIRKDGTRYGVVFSAPGRAGKTVLIPEVVPRKLSSGALEIGRFEVTRAQYAAFDRNYTFEPGTENFPANGILFENAKAYAAWLSKLTGQTWRLPSEDEVAPLYEKREGENTLDSWAGYALNPDDAARLEKKVAELGGPAALLKEVGSFRGAGGEDEELLFDLGGNVAEWVLTKDGSGKTLGGSADRPADSKAGARPAQLVCTGFRVLRGEPATR